MSPPVVIHSGEGFVPSTCRYNAAAVLGTLQSQRIEMSESQITLQTTSSDVPDMKALVAAGFNEWLATLPSDDWGDLYERSIPIYWDEEKGEWIEGEREG